MRRRGSTVLGVVGGLLGGPIGSIVGAVIAVNVHTLIYGRGGMHGDFGWVFPTLAGLVVGGIAGLYFGANAGERLGRDRSGGRSQDVDKDDEDARP